ncbi:GtrA family protein [Candidatus Falkowbacteria bacterium]|nr:GtrA family protein [Candidatus Falkowbacteria bacterium]
MFKQLFSFGIIGVMNTAIDFCVYWVLTRVFGFYFIIANMTAILCAMSFSYFANKTFTFKTTGNHHKEILKFVTVQGSGFVVANVILYTLVYLGIFDIYAKVIASIVFTAYNFTMQKIWVFKDANSQIR